MFPYTEWCKNNNEWCKNDNEWSVSRSLVLTQKMVCVTALCVTALCLTALHVTNSSSRSSLAVLSVMSASCVTYAWRPVPPRSTGHTCTHARAGAGAALTVWGLGFIISPMLRQVYVVVYAVCMYSCCPCLAVVCVCCICRVYIHDYYLCLAIVHICLLSIFLYLSDIHTYIMAWKYLRVIRFFTSNWCVHLEVVH